MRAAIDAAIDATVHPAVMEDSAGPADPGLVRVGAGAGADPLADLAAQEEATDADPVPEEAIDAPASRARGPAICDGNAVTVMIGATDSADAASRVIRCR